MARFGDNPLKSVLVGNEQIPAQDPSTGDDIQFTPLIITQFVMSNGGLANGSTNGLIDPLNYAKLLALDSQAQTNARVAQLSEEAIAAFFSVPTNGTFTIYQHVLDIPWVLALSKLIVSAGSTNVSILKNGVAIAGFTLNPATTVSGQYAVSGGSSNYTFAFGDVLALSFTGTTGNCANLAASIKAIATISP